MNSSFNISSFLSKEFSDTLFNNCTNQLSNITSICFLLCGLFSLAYFANVLMKTWAKGEPIDFHKLFRPFVISIIAFNFNFIYSFIDDVFSPINSFTESITKQDDSSKSETTIELAKAKAKYNTLEKEKSKEGGFWRGVFGINTISSFFDNLYMNAMDLLLKMIEYVATLAFGAVKLTIRAISLAFRIILIIFGPIAFSLSVLPIFKDNWKNWVSKYINVSLFIPIANLMDAIIQQLHITLMSHHIEIYKKAITQISSDASTIDVSLTTINISYIIFLLAFIVLYLMIPSIASYIVSAGGLENLTGGITLAGSAAASKLISGAAPNPLSPNILRLFKRQTWKRAFYEWVHIEDNINTPITISNLQKERVC